MLAFGATLVSDDGVMLSEGDAAPIARSPAPLTGLIEARKVGILKVPTVDSTHVSLIIDLDTIETQRLPPNRHIRVFGQSVPLLHHVDMPHFASSIFLLLKSGQRLLT